MLSVYLIIISIHMYLYQQKGWTSLNAKQHSKAKINHQICHWQCLKYHQNYILCDFNQRGNFNKQDSSKTDSPLHWSHWHYLIFQRHRSIIQVLLVLITLALSDTITQTTSYTIEEPARPKVENEKPKNTKKKKNLERKGLV